MRRRLLLLDPSCENSADPEYTHIDNDVAFLRYLTVSDPLIVRGQHLCDWAANLARARGWEVSWLEPPSSELVTACGTMTVGQAKEFLKRLANLSELTRPLSILEVATSRWTELDMRGKTPEERAWTWLVWRAHATLLPDEEAFARGLGIACGAMGPSSLLPLFQVSTGEDAWLYLRRWLGCEGSTDLPKLPADELPTWAVSRLQSEWRLRAVDSAGEHFQTLLQTSTPRFILRLAAAVNLAYYRENPQALTKARLEALKPFIASRAWQEVCDLLPVDDPGPAPENTAQLVDWFKTKYLPFRLARRQTPEYIQRINQLARDFGLRYLPMYSNARVGGDGSSLLSWSRTAALNATRSTVNLMVVLDGLGYCDAEQVTNLVASEVPRLFLDDVEILMGPLPTITQFAKPSLIRGVTPAQAIEEGATPEVQKNDEAVVQALSKAALGELVVWSLLEPDKTYHAGSDETTIRIEVDGRLRSIVQRLALIVKRVPAERRLRVTVTTDHGRLLSSARRTQPVPSNMTAHGRAAWGRAQCPFDADGIHVEGDVAYLDAQRFGLPEHAAIVLSDEAFLTSDGRTGTEFFPHGGVYPEEVLIPWVQFTRDRSPLAPFIIVTGSGVAGAAGRLRLEVTNTSDVRLRVVRLVLSPSNLAITADLTVGPLKKEFGDWTVARWPEKSDVGQARVLITYLTPTGERHEVQTTPTLETHELYSRDTILDDL